MEGTSPNSWSCQAACPKAIPRIINRATDFDNVEETRNLDLRRAGPRSIRVTWEGHETSRTAANFPV
jgi:hypothetical protein